MRSTLGTVLGTLLIAGCTPKLDAPPRVAVEDHTGRGADLSAARLHAEAAPTEFDAQFAAGMLHVQATLAGDLRQREAAELYLERAWRLDPDAQPTARILGRFLNMRSATLDFDRVDLQVELYESMQAQPVDVEGADLEAFTSDCFLEAARAMQSYRDGHALAAYGRVARLERRVERRLAHHPDEIDTHAMAGNYALNFAGILPVGRRQRLARAIGHLEAQQERWDELTVRARDEQVAPNVRTVWRFMLAEASLAADQPERARVHYEAIAEGSTVASSPRQQLAAVASERLTRLPDYAGREELLPVWPTGAVGCMACHSTTARLPTDGLFVLGER